MKFEYLSEGSADCPLVRIYDFDEEDAAQFKSLVNKVARNPGLVVEIHKAPGVEPVDGCQLTLTSGVRDIGLVETGSSTFNCVLTTEGWDNIAFFVEPFCSICTGYQWLINELLFSCDGQW
jgi:hypothetical protein